MPIYQTPEEYRRYLLTTLDCNPKDVGALVQLGAFEFEHSRDDSKSLSLLKQALELDPANVPARFWMAMFLYYDLFDFAKAQILLKEAIELDLNRPECLSLMARVLCDQGGSCAEAIHYVDQALLQAPDWPMLRYQLAGLLLELGNVQAAEQEVQRAITMPCLDAATITNDVQRYYESVVTGRNWSQEDRKSSYLLERIQQQRNAG